MHEIDIRATNKMRHFQTIDIRNGVQIVAMKRVHTPLDNKVHLKNAIQ